MIRLFRSMWIWVACVSLILAWVPLQVVMWLTDRDPLKLRTGRWIRRLGRNLVRITPWRMQITGQGNVARDEVYVVVSNHQSLADIPIISYLGLDVKWLAKAGLFHFPVVGWMLRMAGDVPVERSDAAARAQAKARCAQYLRRGCSVVFFPEGTRSRDGEILPFNSGPFRLAIQEGVPILPVVVEGSGAALPRNSWVFGRAHTVHLHILEPVPIEAWSPDQSERLRDAIRQKMMDELSAIREGPEPAAAVPMACVQLR